MMRSQFTEALKRAMRERDEAGVSTVRLIIASLKDRDIAARGTGNAEGIDDAQILDMLQKMIKQREESIGLYERGGREDLAAKERREIEVIRRFLPQQMSEAELEAAVEEARSSLGATSIKDMGRLMAELRARYAGQMDFGKASAVAKRLLT